MIGYPPTAVGHPSRCEVRQEGGKWWVHGTHHRDVYGWYWLSRDGAWVFSYDSILVDYYPTREAAEEVLASALLRMAAEEG